MKYYFEKIFYTDFESTVEYTLEALKSEGFYEQLEIDTNDELKKNLQLYFSRYIILGTSNCAPDAIKTLHKDRINDITFSYNVIIHEIGYNMIQVTTIDSISSISAFDSPKQVDFDSAIQAKLNLLFDKLNLVNL